MLKKYKDFSIYYDSKSKQELEKLMPLLETNYDFFKTILPNKISLNTKYINHYKIDDIEKYIKQQIRRIKEEKWVKETKHDLTKLSSIYKQYLYHENDIDNYFNKTEHTSTYDLSCSSFIYYEDIDSIYNSLSKIKEEKEKLLSFLKDHSRAIVLNDLLRKCLIQIDYNYPNLFTLIDPIWEELKEEKNMVIEKTNNKLSPLSYEELINMTRIFLKEIDEEGEYSTIFEELLANKDLKIYENNNQAFNKSNANNKKIKLYVDHNTSDLKTLVHEFIHYVEQKKIQEEPNNYILNEFPSFYYEEQAINFLEKNYLSEEEIKTLRNIRKEYIKEATVAIIDLLDLLKAKIKSDLTDEDALNIINNNRKKLTKEKASKQLDEYINAIISSGTRVYSLTAYVVAYNLAKKYDEDDKYTMKNITMNLDTINPETIINNDFRNYQYKRIL